LATFSIKHVVAKHQLNVSVNICLNCKPAFAFDAIFRVQIRML